MWNIARLMAAVAMGSACVSGVRADMFGTGANQFNIDFVPISGDASSANGTNISQYSPGDWGHKTFTDPGNDYRIGTLEITNDQWGRFENSLGVPVTGTPGTAYLSAPYWTGTNVPTNQVSWLETAQFVNWLNTSTGHSVAYKFTGTQGQSDYTLDTWTAAEADNGENFYRHKDAFYYLPTEDEWVKVGYWNGAMLQTYATQPAESLHQGDGISGAGWNYFKGGYATDPPGPWDVGSGSEELNGTFDMIGNIFEWTESAFKNGDYGVGSDRGVRGGSYPNSISFLASSARFGSGRDHEGINIGFRIASDVPEPSSLMLLSLGGLALLKRKRRA